MPENSALANLKQERLEILMSALEVGTDRLQLSFNDRGPAQPAPAGLSGESHNARLTLKSR